MGKKKTEIFYEFCYSNRIVYKPNRINDVILYHCIEVDEKAEQWFIDNCLEDNKLCLNNIIPIPNPLSRIGKKPIIAQSKEDLMKINDEYKDDNRVELNTEDIEEGHIAILKDGNSIMDIITKEYKEYLLNNYGSYCKIQWNQRNWGCLKDVVSGTFCNHSISFESLNVAPIPCFKALSKMMPKDSMMRINFQNFEFTNRGNGYIKLYEWIMCNGRINERIIRKVRTGYHRFLNKKFNRYEIGFKKLY